MMMMNSSALVHANKSHPLANVSIMSALTVHCWLEGEPARERTSSPSLIYSEAKKMKSVTLHTLICLSGQQKILQFCFIQANYSGGEEMINCGCRTYGVINSVIKVFMRLCKSLKLSEEGVQESAAISSV